MAGPYASGGQPVYGYAVNRAGISMQGWRVGLTDAGLGQYPNMNGIYRALSRTAGPRVLVKVWGEPNPGNTWGVSPTMHADAMGGAWASFAANKNDLMRWLLWPGRVGYTRSPGRAPGFLQAPAGRGDSGAALFVAENGGLDFRVVYGVAFEPLPIEAAGAGHHAPYGRY